MNSWLGGYDAATERDTPYGISAEIGPGTVIRKTSELAAPSRILNMIDEQDDSINDGYSVVAMFNSVSAEKIVDYRSSYHNGAGGLNFADGHSETHKWVDPRTRTNYQKDIRLSVLPPNPSPNNKDVLWLQQRATSK